MTEWKEWLDFDANQVTPEDISEELKAAGYPQHYIRPDVFENYEDGRRVQRVYLTEKPECTFQGQL